MKSELAVQYRYSPLSTLSENGSLCLLWATWSVFVPLKSPTDSIVQRLCVHILFLFSWADCPMVGRQMWVCANNANDNNRCIHLAFPM